MKTYAQIQREAKALLAMPEFQLYTQSNGVQSTAPGHYPVAAMAREGAEPYECNERNWDGVLDALRRTVEDREQCASNGSTFAARQDAAKQILQKMAGGKSPHSNS